MQFRMRIAVLIGAGIAVFGCAGCESPAWTHTLNESFKAANEDGTPQPRNEEEYRRDYVKTHNRKSMRWLLAHCVEPGMPFNDVCQALGEEGERETKDRWLKTGGVNIRIDDEVYSFGPDSDGRMLYLFFREGRLINFNPDDFK